MRHALLATALLTACIPGEIRWATGDDVLRTALYVENDPLATGVGTRILLSTGQFGCTLPAEEDPNRQEAALLALAVGACREDARHLAIRLWRDPAVARDGTYRGEPGAGPAMVDATTPRLATVDYVGIEEAVLTASDLPQFGDALSSAYRPTEITQELGAGVGGRVTIRGDEVITGTFDFPDVHVSGRFRAEACPAGSELFDFAFSGAVVNCP